MADTPVWSAAFRRASENSDPVREEMRRLVAQGSVEIMGPIRQEILSGIRDHAQFLMVRDRLRSFSDLEIITADYEEAASYYNKCRSKGIQGSFTDYLICAVAVRHKLEIFTTDQDFLSYRKILPIRLYSESQT